MEENTKSLNEKINEWVNVNGYPLEMQVARICKEEGFFYLNQSLNYSDPETNETREIDVVANTFITEGDSYFFTFTLVIECKSKGIDNDKENGKSQSKPKSKPWVLFTSKDSLLFKDALVSGTASTENGKKLLERLARKEEIQNLCTFKMPERVGIGVTQAFTNGLDVTYKAIKSVSKATEAFIKQNNQNHSRGCDFFFPIIVIEEKLFECYLTKEQKTETNEINNGILIANRSYQSNSKNIIYIVTQSGFRDFIKSIKNDIIFLQETQKSELNWLIQTSPLTTKRKSGVTYD